MRILGSAALTVFAFALVASPPATAQNLPLCDYDGSWEPAFDPIPSGPPTGTCQIGFPTIFEAIHVSLIPKGDYRGWVLVWDAGGYTGPVVGARTMRYSLINPVTQVREDHCFTLPSGLGDLFCSGSAWTADGDLFIAGGTTCHDSQGTCPSGYGGSTLAYLWRPPDALAGIGPAGRWDPVVDALGAPKWLDEERWYPAVTVLGRDPGTLKDLIMVAGGNHEQNSVNSYQVWIPPDVGDQNGGTWQANPTTANNTFAGSTNSDLWTYPRLHLLSAPVGSTARARVAMAGFFPTADRIAHYTAPGVWLPGSQAGWQMIDDREYGSAVLMPLHAGNRDTWDRLLAIGGKGATNGIMASMQWSLANVPSPATLGWLNYDSLAQKRFFPNTVGLPDGRILVVGGEQESTTYGCSEVPALIPEVIDPSQPVGTRVRPLQAGTIVRDYHSVALLLPSGKILTAGGEYRRKSPLPLGDCATANLGMIPETVSPADYQVFRPDYIDCQRPVIEGVTDLAGTPVTNLALGQEYHVKHLPLAEGTSIQKVTLVRAGSVTHHHDSNQRVVELNKILVDGDRVKIFMPSLADNILPRGYYLLFVVNNQTVNTQGVPSAALWVKVV